MKEVTWFFGSHFHQDWGMDAKTPDGVIELFLRRTSETALLKELAGQLRHYLASEKDDPSIERDLYDKLDCNYAPQRDGMTARQWLSHVADMFEDAIQKKEHHDSFLPAAVSDQASRQGLKRKRPDEGFEPFEGRG